MSSFPLDEASRSPMTESPGVHTYPRTFVSQSDARPRVVRYLVTLAMTGGFAVGCADNSKSQTTAPASADQRQDATLQDPWSYGGNPEKVDMTGGDLGTFDKKAFKRDVDAVLNP